MRRLIEEYKFQKASIENKIEALERKYENGSKVEKYQIKRKLKIYGEMRDDCTYAINQMNKYCQAREETKAAA